jgi:hypothetical protein
MWFMPSRGRPSNVARFFQRYAETGADSPGRVLLDDDDPQLSLYQALVATPPNWDLVVAPRIGLGPMENRAFNEHPNEPWYGCIGDDAVPVTAGWDRLLIEAAGLDGLAYGADGISDEAHAGHCVMGGDFVRANGWLTLPGLMRLYGDNVRMLIARRRGVLRYCADVRIEHWHFSNRKAPMDETYRKPEAEADRLAYERWLSQ